MSFSLSLRGRLIGGSELRSELATRGALWAAIEASEGPFREGDSLHVVGLEGEGISLVERADGALALTGADERGSPVGRIDQVVRGRQPWRLDRGPFRVWFLKAPPHVVDRGLRLAAAVVRALAQLGPPPSATEALGAQEELYDSDEMLEDAGDLDGLSEVEEILAEKWLDAGARVLDIGCGTGREALAFAARGHSVVAIDVSRRSVEVAKSRASKRGLAIETHVGPIEEVDPDDAPFDVVYFGSDVYAGIPGRENRIRALTHAHRQLRPGGRVLFQAMPPANRARALLLDGLRELFARGAPIERGDRVVWYGPPPRRLVRHAFFSDDEVVAELEAAGLAFVSRCSSYVIAQKPVDAPRGRGSSAPPSWLREIANVMWAVPRVESLRRRTGPVAALAELRRDAARRPRRDAQGRARLGHAIGLWDALLPSRGGCYRRVLLEVALDAGAATEPVFLGFHGVHEGHAWLERVSPSERFASVVSV